MTSPLVNSQALTLTLGNNLEAAPLRALDTATQSAFSPRAKKAAQEFESLLLASWLQEIQHGFSGSLTGEDTDVAAGSLQGLAVSAVSQAMAASGGIGVAKMILQQLQSEETQKAPQAQ